MNIKPITNNQHHHASSQSYYCTQPDEIRQTFSQSSFLQVNSVLQQQSPSNSSSYQVEQKTRLRSSNPNQQTKSKIIVENLCNQIKYLIQGNLKNEQLKINMGDIVRDNIIPMLIKMFFQQSVDKKIGFFGSKQMSSTIQSKNNDYSQKEFLNQDWQTHSVDSFNHKVLSKFNNNSKPKSVLISSQTHKEVQQINDQESYITENQKTLYSNQIQQNKITGLLVFAIILLKFEIIKKAYSFQRLKSFSLNKQKILKNFVNIFNKNKVKCCILKFKQNKQNVQKKMNQQKLNLQKQIFKNKTASIASHIILKIIKQKCYQFFSQLKNNSLNQNKWMKSWVRIAALKSPLTLKTSVWRLKNYAQNQNKKNKPSSIKKSKEQFETSIKQIIITQEIQDSNKPFYQVSKKSFKKSHGNISQKQSSSQSITSAQFDAMFQNQPQSEIIESERSMKKSDKVIDNIQQVRIQEKQQNQQSQSNGYLNTISQDENQLSSICE